MSTVIFTGAAFAAVAACGRIAQDVSRKVKQTITWLGEANLRELEKLEQTLTKPVPQFVTNVEARTQFETLSKEAAKLAMQHPALKPHSVAIGHYVALKQSALTDFLSISDWQSIHQAPTDKRSFQRIAKNTVERFNTANTHTIIESVKEAAAEAGFTNQLKEVENGKIRDLVFTDKNGQALLSQVKQTSAGASLTLDIPSASLNCGKVMDKIIHAIEKRNIKLANIQRKTHFNPAGVLRAAVNRFGKTQKPKPATALTTTLKKKRVKAKKVRST